MGQYISTGIINHRGKVHFPGDEIDLTEKQAEAMQKHIVKKAVATAKVKGAGAKELRKLAKEAGVKNYSSKKKEELSAELEAVQNEVPAEAVNGNGSDNR